MIVCPLSGSVWTLKVGIFLRQLRQRHAHLFLIGLGLRLDRNRNHRHRKHDRLQRDRMLFVADGVARTDVSEADHGADVSGQNFLDVFALIGVHLEQAANALMLLRARVQHRLARVQLSRVHTDKRQLTDIRVGHDLEGQGRERLVVVSFARDRLPSVGIEAMRFFGVERRGQVIDHRVEQRLDTFILERRSHHHRKQLQPDRGFAQRCLQFVRRNRFAFQKFVQNVVVIFGDGFDQSGYGTPRPFSAGPRECRWSRTPHLWSRLPR